MGCGSSSEITYTAVCPKGGKPGQTIVTKVNGVDHLVVIPQGAKGGQMFRFPASASKPVPTQGNRHVQSGGGPADPNFENLQVTVPPGVRPGQTFQVNVMGTLNNVTCPPGLGPGSSFTIQIRRTTPAPPPPPPVQATAPPPPPAEVRPKDYEERKPKRLGNLDLAFATSSFFDVDGTEVEAEATLASEEVQVARVIPDPPQKAPSAPPSAPTTPAVSTAPSSFSSPETPVQRLASTAPPSAPQSPSATVPVDITVPQGVSPGQTFEVVANGLKLGIMCPANVQPGQVIRIQVPASAPSSPTPVAAAKVPSAPPTPTPAASVKVPSAPPSPAPVSAGPKPVRVTVPAGVAPGAAFEVNVDGKRVRVVCPQGAGPGTQLDIIA